MGFSTQMLAAGDRQRQVDTVGLEELRAHNLLNTGAIYANDGCDVCERQVQFMRVTGTAADADGDKRQSFINHMETMTSNRTKYIT